MKLLKLKKFWSDEAITEALVQYLNDDVTNLTTKFENLKDDIQADFINKFIAGDFIVENR